MSDLSAKKLLAIEHLLTGRTLRQTAKLVKTSERQLGRWLRDPVFTAEYRRARKLAFDGVITRLQTIATEAVETLGSLMRDPQVRAGIRARCGLGVLKLVVLAHDVSTTEDLQSKLESLEEQLQSISAESLV